MVTELHADFFECRASVGEAVLDDPLGEILSNERDLVIQAESGYGSFTPGVMKKLIWDEPAVAGWSEFAFAQLPVDGRVVVPALGLRRQLGSVQPPTTSGHALTGPARSSWAR